MSNYCVFESSHEVRDISYQQLSKLFDEKKVVMIYGYGEGCTTASVRIFDSAEEAEEFAEEDTRGECYSMWEEQWSEVAKNKFDMLKACQY